MTTGTLPISLAPFGQETLGSYLCRLAIANKRPVRTLGLLLGPVPRNFSPIDDDADWWSPEAPDRLADLTGRTTTQLARAIPAIVEALTPAAARRAPYLLNRLCRLCAARRGAGATLVITRTPIHQHLCIRHRRWTRASSDIAVDNLPDLFRQQRRLQRLVREHDPHTVRHHLDLAERIIRGWATSEWWSGPLQAVWENRLDPIHRPENLSPDERRQVAAFPEKVLLATLMLKPPISTSAPRLLYQAMAEVLSDDIGIVYAHRPRFDPLYRHFCKTQVD
jgi:hypothetical protein